MGNQRQFSIEESRSIGDLLNIQWAEVDLNQFRRGLEAELEHGAREPETKMTGDDPLLTGKIAWAHLKEIQNYYTLLGRMEAEAKKDSRVGVFLFSQGAVICGACDIPGWGTLNLTDPK